MPRCWGPFWATVQVELTLHAHPHALHQEEGEPPAWKPPPGLSLLSTPTSPIRVSWAGNFHDAHGDSKVPIYLERLFWNSRLCTEP